MKHSITFSQLRRFLKESEQEQEIITERNDEEPITVADVPAELAQFLKREFGATIHNNDVMPLPYLYVTIPLNDINSRHGSKLRTTYLNQVEDKVDGCGWYIIDRFEADRDCPNYTILISPYRNPHEPGMDELDSLLSGGRKEELDEGDELDDEADDVAVSEDGDDGDTVIREVNDSLGEINLLIFNSKLSLTALAEGIRDVETVKKQLAKYVHDIGIEVDKALTALKN